MRGGLRRTVSIGMATPDPGSAGAEPVDQHERTEQTVSASREKKTRQDVADQAPSAREQKRQQEAAEARRSTILYRVVGVLCVALVAFLLVWNAGLIQRSATAVTIHGVKYTAADVQYYYNNLVNQYTQYGMSSVSMKDYLLTPAVEALKSDLSLADKAEAEGYTMSEEARSYLDSQISLLDAMDDQKGFIQTNYGPYMTYEKLVTLLERQTLASDYANSYLDALDYSAADLQSYYQENKDALDTFTLSQFVLQAKVGTSDTEMSEEEKTAALEEAKAQTKAVAEEIQSKLEAGEDPAALAEEYADQLYSSQISDNQVGSSVNSAYTEWIYDGARRENDVTLSEYDSGTAYNYYVVRFEGRALDETPTNNVRHILITPEKDEGATEATEEQIAAAKAQAEELLAQWKAGAATEDSFAALAQENSADSGSAADGGLISNITPDSSYVESFRDWAVDPARQVGYTGLVESSYGWHIMYYAGSGDPVWKLTAKTSLRNQDYSAWLEAAEAGYEATTSIGMKFVQG